MLNGSEQKIVVEEKQRNKLSRKQTIEGHALIASHIRKVAGEDDLYEYEEGWNDQRVANELAYEGVSGIQNLRMEMFGKLRRAPAPATDRIAVLEKEVASTQSLLLELCEKFDKLIDNLAVNQVGQVKHLRVGRDKN